MCRGLGVGVACLDERWWGVFGCCVSRGRMTAALHPQNSLFIRANARSSNSSLWKCCMKMLSTRQGIRAEGMRGISAWLSRLNYPGLIRKGLPEQPSALTRGRWVWIFRWKRWFSWIRFGSGCCFLQHHNRSLHGSCCSFNDCLVAI